MNNAPSTFRCSPDFSRYCEEMLEWVRENKARSEVLLRIHLRIVNPASNGDAHPATKGDTGEACPSRKTLSMLTGISCRDVSRVSKELQDAGFMVVSMRKGMANVYRLTYQKNTNAGIADEDWQREAQNMAEGTGER